MSSTHTFGKTTLATLLLLSLGACSIFSGSESGGQYVDDTTITTKVKESFVADPQVQASQIHVETMHGVVQLSGFVQSPKSEARAVELARQTDGVRSVKDNIVIGVATNPGN